MDVRWCIAIVLIFIRVFIMLVSRIWKIFLIFWIDGLCGMLLALAVITIISGTFQPLLYILSKSGAYFSIFSFEN